MKTKLHLLFSFLLNIPIIYAQCSTTFVTTQDCNNDYIKIFSMNGIATGIANNNTNETCNSNGYYLFATPVRSLIIGETIPWTATSGDYFEFISIWIDLNNNNIFDDTELVSSSNQFVFNHSQSFVMPNGVTNTPLKMRVRCAYNYTFTATQACLNIIGPNYYGETEDYFVILNPSLNTSSFNGLDFKIFPNPSNGIVNITLENNLQLEKVTIYNQLGQIVKIANTTLITTTELTKGTYFVEIITNEGKATKQLIVQ